MQVASIRLVIALVFLTAMPAAEADAFEWSLLQGQWAESTRHQFGCRPDNLHHEFVVSSDRKRITFKLDRNWKIGTGREVKEYSASVLQEQPNALIIRYGPELQDIPDEMREWELRFIGPGTYRWRATAWPAGEYNEVVGVKCR